MDLLIQIIAIAAAVVGAARVIMHGVSMITAITPSTRDDEIVTNVQHWIKKIQQVLNSISLSSNPGGGK